MNELTVGHLFDLRNKTVLIAGASNPIGSTLAHAFAFYDAKVILVDNMENSTDNMRRIIEDMGRDCLTFAIEMTDNVQAKDMVEAIRNQTGVIDIFVNAVGLSASADGGITNEIGLAMRSQGFGKIILTAAFLPFAQRPDPVNAAVLKGSVEQMTRRLAGEWAQSGISVNAVGSEGTPLRKIDEPSEMVGAYLFFAAAASDSITGQVIYVNN